MKIIAKQTLLLLLFTFSIQTLFGAPDAPSKADSKVITVPSERTCKMVQDRSKYELLPFNIVRAKHLENRCLLGDWYTDKKNKNALICICTPTASETNTSTPLASCEDYITQWGYSKPPSQTREKNYTIDTCLLGEWYADKASLKDIGKWLTNNLNTLTGNTAASAKMTFLDLKGGMHMCFDANGLIYKNVDKLRTKMSISLPGTKINTTMTVSSKTYSNFNTSKQEIVLKNVHTNANISAHIVTSRKGKSMNMDKSIHTTKLYPESVVFPYRCNHTTLEIDGPQIKDKGAPTFKFLRRP